MDIDLTFEDSISQMSGESERRLIKELVELRQYKLERDQLVVNNKALVSELSEMEVKMTDLEVKLNAKEKELTHLRSRIKRMQSAESESTNFEILSPLRRSELCSDTTEDLQVMREALEKEQKENIRTKTEMESLFSQLKDTEKKLGDVSHERDQLRSLLEARKNNDGQKILTHRKTNTSFRVSLTETSEMPTSISKEMISHQFMFSPKIPQLNKADAKKGNTQRKQKYTPSFLRQKKYAKKRNDETFADSFPEENET